MKGRARQDESVHQRHGKADLDTVAQGEQHPAGGRPVNVNPLACPRIQGGNDVGLPVHDEADVANVAFVEDRAHLRLVVDGALGQPPHVSPISG